MTSDSGRGFVEQERDDFLTTTALFAKIATADPSGWPMLSPVWYEWEPGTATFLIVSKERTNLVKNLRNDQRCSVLVDSTSTPYARVTAKGRVEFLGEEFDWITPARRMALRYLGEEGLSYAEATFGFARVPFRVHVQMMATWNGKGFDRTFTRDTLWHEK